MKRFAILMLAGATVLPTAAAAHDTQTTYSSRGACEAARAGENNEEADGLLQRFPDIFDSRGDVSSFLTRAFSCDINSDGEYQLSDHRAEVLGSAWFQRK